MNFLVWLFELYPMWIMKRRKRQRDRWIQMLGEIVRQEMYVPQGVFLFKKVNWKRDGF